MNRLGFFAGVVARDVMGMPRGSQQSSVVAAVCFLHGEACKALSFLWSFISCGQSV
jgi:hypothetical protein